MTINDIVVRNLILKFMIDRDFIITYANTATLDLMRTHELFWWKIKAKYSPMDPDTQHLHQLIFRKFLACFNNRVVISNSLTGITINTYHLIIFYISFLNYSESLFQVYMITLNIMIYLFLYFLLKNNLFIKK